MRWPTLGQQSGIGARSLPQSSGKQDYVSRQVGQDMAALEKKLQSEAPLRKVVNSDSASMQDFANSYETLRTQTVLNSMGYTGPNGEAVPETGQLEENTLYAWYRMRSDRDPFRSFSQEMHDFLAAMTGQNRKWAKPKLRVEPMPEQEGALWDIVRTDRTARRDFSGEEAVLQMQEWLNSRGYTGPNGETLRDDGILDENTLYAWYLMKSTEDPSLSFSEEIHDFLAEWTGQDETEDEVWWVYRQFWAGVVNMINDPIRLFYNLFMGGDYDPKNAKNEIGRFVRNNLVWQDQVNQAAAESLEQIDDSNAVGLIVKNYLAPLIEELPSLIVDAAVLMGTGGLSAAAHPALLTTGTAAQGIRTARRAGMAAKSLYDDLIYAAAQPITAVRTVNYLTEYTNRLIEEGNSPEYSFMRGLALAIPSAILDGRELIPLEKEGSLGVLIGKNILDEAKLSPKDAAIDVALRINPAKLSENNAEKQNK